MKKPEAKKPESNPLANLNLGGLAKIEEQSNEKGIQHVADAVELEPLSLESVSKAQPKKQAFKAGVKATEEPTLGPLQNFPGTWEGSGFNLIEIPNRNQDPTAPPHPDKFKLVLNNTHETLTITEIPGVVFNRGNAQGDIGYLSLHYLQTVDDVNVQGADKGIHLETGLFLNLPASTEPAVAPSVARLGSIPHGDSLLAQGTFGAAEPGQGPDFNFNRADPMPFTIIDGKRVNRTNEEYLSLLKNATPPDGIPKEAILDPTVILEAALKGKKVLDMMTVFLDANPVDGVSNPNAIKDIGGISNIPFVTKNANATTFSAIFWLMTVQGDDGKKETILQYTQTVILDFPVFGTAPPHAVTDIKWPHISVATLVKQG